MVMVRRAPFALLAALSFSMLAPAALAAPAWHRLVPFSRVEADADKSYRITDKNGPWMVMAATFSGDGAQQQAHQLALELRREHGIEAFVQDKKFDFSSDLRGRGFDRYGSQPTWKYRRGNQAREFAVLVGNFSTINDKSAAKMLKKIKHLWPKTLEASKEQTSWQNLRAWRALIPNLNQSKRQEQRGPMGKAFLTTNPMLPPEYFAPKGVDKLVLDINRGVKYSLLDCPGKYTVTVATFKGTVILKQERIKAIADGKTRDEQGNQLWESKLAKAAMKAHKVTLALREKGYDAYEFHDRGASLVTVGSFSSPGNTRADGKIEINPKMYKIMQTFGARQINAGPRGMVSRPQVVAGIALDIQPTPVQVPKRSLSSDYAGGFGLFR
jgi:hypothetical protein